MAYTPYSIIIEPRSTETITATLRRDSADGTVVRPYRDDVVESADTFTVSSRTIYTLVEGGTYWLSLLIDGAERASVNGPVTFTLTNPNAAFQISPLAGRSQNPLPDFFGSEMEDGDMETMSRELVSSNVSLTTQTLRMAYFRARRNKRVTAARTICTTGAVATPTVCGVMLFSINESTGDATCIAVTANTTTLWATTGTSYTPAFSAPVDIVRGGLYAVGVLSVTAQTAGAICAAATTSLTASEISKKPKLAGSVAAQSALPALGAVIATASIAPSGGRFYAALVS